MNSDAAESAKVLGVERQQIPDSVHAHSGHYWGVMDLYTRDARRNYDSPPLLVSCSAVGRKREFRFDQNSGFIRLSNGESEPVPISQSSTRVRIRHSRYVFLGEIPVATIRRVS
jgi:hypothetical protein